MWKYYVMFAVVQTIGRMPLQWRYGISRIVSDRTYAWRPSIRNNIRDNVRHVLGPEAPESEIARVSRQCSRNTGRYYADVIGMHRMDVQAFYENELRLDGVEYIREAQAQGRGVVLASAHYANPEFATQGLAAAGIRVFALVEPLRPPQLAKLMYSLRNVHGHQYEAANFKGVKAALDWLRKAGVLAILIDRDIQKRGIELEFCGAVGRFPTGAVDLAIRTNAILLPGWVRREGGFRVHARLGPPLDLILTGDHDHDLRVNTHRLLKLFEAHLKQDPGQWSVVDRIWPAEAATPRSQ
jgi:KDO2-lipid IV(A) lauroyltransferase